MHFIDWILLAVILAAVIGAIAFIRRQHQNGKTCCGDCSQCSGCCGGNSCGRSS